MVATAFFLSLVLGYSHQVRGARAYIEESAFIEASILDVETSKVVPPGFPITTLHCAKSVKGEPAVCTGSRPKPGTEVPGIFNPQDLCDGLLPVCDPSYRYYRIDGKCNNLQNTLWGAANIPFRRLLSPQYGPGDTPKGFGAAQPLPNARLISTTIHQDINIPDPNIALLTAHFGQFLDHDITLTPQLKIECCGGGGYQGKREATLETEKIKPPRLPKGCFNIDIPEKEKFFTSTKPPRKCLDFARSKAFCDREPREQFNAITAFVDGSNIYGSDDTTAYKLREHVGGRLKTDSNQQLPEILLPNENDEEVLTRGAGDVRAIVQPGLTSIHTVWLREHNRIAQQVAISIGSADDEKIYQTTRKLVISEWQNIVYSEWLPIILGPDAISSFELKVDSQMDRYKKKEDPSIINSFATSAFRFGHSLLQGLVSLYSKSGVGTQTTQYKLRDHFLNTVLYLSSGGLKMEEMLKGQTLQSMQKNEQFGTEDVTNFLLQQLPHNLGSDLFARNIQRGRDHGLPGYNQFRKFCGLTPLTSFTSATVDLNLINLNLLQSVYTSIDDIDLFTAGLLEAPVSGGVLGPTFACIIGQQFKQLLYGDRHFFTHTNQVGSLTATDFAWARSRTFRSILCDNTGIEMLQRNVFLTGGGQRKCKKVFVPFEPAELAPLKEKAKP